MPVVILIIGEFVCLVIICYMNEKQWYSFFPLTNILVMKHFNFPAEGDTPVARDFFFFFFF